MDFSEFTFPHCLQIRIDRKKGLFFLECDFTMPKVC